MLSIDLDLQKKVDGAARRRRANGGQAAAIVMDVHTGEVLALVSLPMYDNNIFSGKIDEARLEQYLNDPKKPLVNHALAEQYAPGSIFKQITGSAALQEGVATPSTTITSNGYINVPNEYDPSVVYTFRTGATLGTLNFYGGVAMSSDVYFYYLAGGYHAYGQNFDGLGIDRLAKYARAFGLGPPTGIDIAGEADGNVPDPDVEEGDVRRRLDARRHVQHGHRAGIRRGDADPDGARDRGRRERRHAAHAARRARGARRRRATSSCRTSRRSRRQVPVSPENFAIMREAMTQAVSWGSANAGGRAGVKVAGKTGTAEFGPRFADGSLRDARVVQRLRAGRRPADRRHGVPASAASARSNAAPLASKILDYYFHRPQQHAPTHATRRRGDAVNLRNTPTREFDFVLLLAAVGADGVRRAADLQRQPHDVRLARRRRSRTPSRGRSRSPRSGWSRWSALSRIDYRLLGPLSLALYVVSIAALVFVLVVGSSAYGSRRWIAVAGTQVQPSEIAKVCTVIMLAKYFSDNEENMRLAARVRDVDGDRGRARGARARRAGPGLGDGLRRHLVGRW